jgi:hypothetical protein
LGVAGVQLADVPMIVRLYTPKPAHVDLLKIIEVRRKDTRWVSHVVSNGATLASYTKTWPMQA